MSPSRKTEENRDEQECPFREARRGGHAPTFHMGAEVLAHPKSASRSVMTCSTISTVRSSPGQKVWRVGRSRSSRVSLAAIQSRRWLDSYTGLQPVDAAEAVSIQLTPPEFASSPAVFRRSDESSVFRPKNSTVFSSGQLLDAEERLLQLAHITTGPTVSLTTVERVTRKPDRDGLVLGEDQASALTEIAVSGRVVDLLVGPAGAGKTTAMNALRRAWEKEHGQGSVVGLAPSSSAALVLAEDLGIATENTAKWWQNHLREGENFQLGQLVIVDEASLAGTLFLDQIAQLAAGTGAKVLLVGDYAQLQAVDAGGAFGMLSHDRDDVPELIDVHRFAHDWEKCASLDLRHGHAEVINT